MSVFTLQLLAMITMVCDHIGICFMGGSIPMRCIGRFAFPIYAFLLAEGFRHIKNDESRVSSHLSAYVMLALISELPYDIMEIKPLVWSAMIRTQNNIITLLIAFLGLIAIDKWKNKPLRICSVVILSAFCNYFICSNYKFVGVLIVYAFYFYLNWAMDKNKNYLERLLMLLLIFIIYIPIYHLSRYNFCNITTFVEKLHGANTYWYLTHILIAVVLATYVGNLGFYSKKFKLFYKWFYPIHMAIIGIIFQFI